MRGCLTILILNEIIRPGSLEIKWIPLTSDAFFYGLTLSPRKLNFESREIFEGTDLLLFGKAIDEIPDTFV